MTTPPSASFPTSDPAWFQKQLIDASPLGSLILEPHSLDPVILYANAAFGHLTGYSLNEVVGQPLSVFHRSEQDYPVLRLIQSNLREQTACEVTLSYYRKDDKSVWVELLLFPLRDAQGKISHWFVQHKDVTQDRERLQQLEARETRYRTLFEQTQDAVLLLNLNGSVRDANPRASELFGYTHDELMQMSQRDLVAPEEYALHENTRRDVLNGVPLSLYECLYVRKDGQRGTAELQLALVQDTTATKPYIQCIVHDITARKKGEAQLKIQSLALEAAADAILITDLAGRVEWCNRAYLALTGYSRAELYGQNPRGLIQSGTQDEAFYDHMWTIILSGQVWHGQVVNRRKDGSLYTVIQSITPVKDHAGALYRFIAIQEDVTEQQKIEQALHERATQHHSLITSLSEGVVLQAADGTIQTCNQAAEHILGLTIEQMMGRTSIDPLWRAIREDGTPFPGEEHPSMMTLRTGQPFSHIIMGVYKPDERLTWISINTQPIFELDSEQPSAVVSSFTDITISRQLEMDLRSSETRLRNLVESMQDIVWSIDLKTSQIIYMNHNMETIYGLKASEFINNRMLWYEVVHPDDRGLVAKTTLETVEDGGKDIEYRIIRPDGSIRWLRDRAWVVYDDSGAPLRLEGLASDNTAYRQTQAHDFEIALEKERLDLLTTFIQHAAHEFRTPLAIISSSMYMMEISDSVEKRGQYAKRVEAQVQRTTKLVDSLSMLVKLKSGAYSPLFSVDILRLLQLAQNDLRPDPSQPSIVYDVEVVPPIQGHEDDLRDAFKELLGNALRYTPAQGQVVVRVKREADYAIIEVQDTGKGIPPESLPLIFDTFWRDDQAHTTPGFGLGLVIVKQIIEIHKGTVEVESKPDQGSLFRVRLPFTQA